MRSSTSVKAAAAVIVSFLFAMAASAHMPSIPSGDAEKAVADPTVRSQAIYAHLKADATDVYSFIASKDAEIPVEVLVPYRPSLADFRPSFAFIGPDVEDAGRDGYRGAVPEGEHATVVAAPEERDVFYEPYGMEKYWHGTERRLRVTAGNRYRIAVFEPEGRPGDYVIGAGTVEDFKNADFAGLLVAVAKSKLGAVTGRDIPWADIAGLMLFVAGFVVGLGAVTVIDTLGFLGRRSPYWTETTIRAHKVTKPLIWIGTGLAALGGAIIYRGSGPSGTGLFHAVILAVLVLNGCYLSFVVSPVLLKREKDGKAAELLPAALQRRIAVSFVVSFLGWWSAVFLLAWHVIMLR